MNIYKLLSTVVVSGFFLGTSIDATAMIPDPRDEQITALTKERDFYVAKADYLQKTGIIQQMFRGISNALRIRPGLREFMSTSSSYDSVDGSAWRQFLRTMRYLGGNTNTEVPDLVDANDKPGSAIVHFVTNPRDTNGVYIENDYSTGGISSNANATFANFVEESTLDNLSLIANGDLLLGLRDIRDFVSGNFPNLSYILQHIGEENFRATSEFVTGSNVAFPGTDINGNGNIRFDLGESISEIFDTNRRFAALDNLGELGITNDSARQTAFMKDIELLYNQNCKKFVQHNK